MDLECKRTYSYVYASLLRRVLGCRLFQRKYDSLCLVTDVAALRGVSFSCTALTPSVAGQSERNTAVYDFPPKQRGELTNIDE